MKIERIGRINTSRNLRRNLATKFSRWHGKSSVESRYRPRPFTTEDTEKDDEQHRGSKDKDWVTLGQYLELKG
jgi:hypothetical protein